MNIDKAGLVEKIQSLIDNPGTDGEREAAETVLRKIKEKYKNGDTVALATMPDCRTLRCDRCMSVCVSRHPPPLRAFCGYAPKSFVVTGNYLDGKSPNLCPHKIKAYLKYFEATP